MSTLFWRIIIAVICVVAIFALLPPLFRILEFEASGDVITIIKVCVSLIALLYIVKGPPFVLPN